MNDLSPLYVGTAPRCAPAGTLQQRTSIGRSSCGTLTETRLRARRRGALRQSAFEAGWFRCGPESPMSSLDRWADQLDDERLIRSFSDHLRPVGVIPTLAPWRAENATGDGSICVFELETQDPIRLVNLRVI